MGATQQLTIGTRERAREMATQQSLTIGKRARERERWRRNKSDCLLVLALLEVIDFDDDESGIGWWRKWILLHSTTSTDQAVILAISAAALGDIVFKLAKMAAALAACRSASSRTEDDVEVDEADDSFVGELPGVYYVRRRRTRKIAMMH